MGEIDRKWSSGGNFYQSFTHWPTAHLLCSWVPNRPGTTLVYSPGVENPCSRIAISTNIPPKIYIPIVSWWPEMGWGWIWASVIYWDYPLLLVLLKSKKRNFKKSKDLSALQRAQKYNTFQGGRIRNIQSAGPLTDPRAQASASHALGSPEPIKPEK